MGRNGIFEATFGQDGVFYTNLPLPFFTTTRFQPRLCLPVLLESFICSIWCGATRFLHTEVTRSYRALSKIFGWRQVSGQDAYKRFFSKSSQTDDLRVSDYFYKWIFNNFNIKKESNKSIPYAFVSWVVVCLRAMCAISCAKTPTNCASLSSVFIKPV